MSVALSVSWEEECTSLLCQCLQQPLVLCARGCSRGCFCRIRQCHGGTGASLLETGRSNIHQKSLNFRREKHISSFNLDVQLSIVNISFPLLLSPRRVISGGNYYEKFFLCCFCYLMPFTIAQRGPGRDQSFLAHHPPVFPATFIACAAIIQLRARKGAEKAGSLFYKEGREAQREAITCAKTRGESQTELGTVMQLFHPSQYLTHKIIQFSSDEKKKKKQNL